MTRATAGPAGHCSVSRTMTLVITIYAALSLITFVVYALDKRAAQRSRRRIPEGSLHLLALLGGVAGALVAQQVLRHKRRKIKFMALTVAIALLHVAGWLAWWWLGAAGRA